MSGSPYVARTVAFLGRCSQCKLAHGKYITSNVGDRAVHYPVFVVEYAKRGCFGCKPFHIVGSVAMLNAYEYEQTAADFGYFFALDCH